MDLIHSVGDILRLLSSWIQPNHSVSDWRFGILPDLVKVQFLAPEFGRSEDWYFCVSPGETRQVVRQDTDYVLSADQVRSSMEVYLWLGVPADQVDLLEVLDQRRVTGY